MDEYVECNEGTSRRFNLSESQLHRLRELARSEPSNPSRMQAVIETDSGTALLSTDAVCLRLKRF